VNFTGDSKVTTMKRVLLIGLRVTFLAALLCVLPSQHPAFSAYKLCPQRECHCATTGYDCLKILPIKNPAYVHFQVINKGGDYFTQIRLMKGSKQWEAKNGQVIYVPRGKEKTEVKIQGCLDALTGIYCGQGVGWTHLALRVPSGNALAACEAYADKAVATYTQAKKLNCGFKDGYWVEDRTSHYNWCANLADGDRHQPDEHTKARQQGLKDCKAKIAAANAPPPPPPPVKNYGGTWDVEMSGAKYTLVLTQQGPAITGQIINADPRLNGTVQGSMESDGRAKFSYVQPQANTGGSGRFWLSESVDKLSGRFTFNGDQALRLLEGCRDSCRK
jgi:hypothetical protein